MLVFLVNARSRPWTDAGMVTLGTFSSLGLAKDARRKAQTTHGYSERHGEA